MGSSERKLFVAGLSLREIRNDEENEREQLVLEMCTEAAIRCGEPFYFCFIPHPEAWDEPGIEEYELPVWVLDEDEWSQIP